MNISLKYRLLSRGKTSRRIIKSTGWQPAHCLLSNFFAPLPAQICRIDRLYPFYDPGGVLYFANPDNANLDTTAGTNVSDNGIQIGTDTTPVRLDDYKLAHQLISSYPPGGVLYLEQLFSMRWDSDTSSYFYLLRNFQNNNLTPLTLNEVGWVCRVRTSVPTTVHALVARDTIAPFIVLPSFTAEVDYQIEITL